MARAALVLLSTLVVCGVAMAKDSAVEHIFDPLPTVLNCTKKWKTQWADHFGWQNQTFKQRYYVYDKWWKPGGPILFQTGNEAPITLFVNWTGSMWSFGRSLNAVLIFAEHRYFGESLPCPGGWRECGDYLGSEQAMADFAALIADLKVTYSNHSGVVAVGGSYGGMLAAWMRMRYPALVDGAIASSAPIGCMSPDYDPANYWRVVTRDATGPYGSAPQCAPNVHATLQAARGLFNSSAGRDRVAKAFRLCQSGSQLTEKDKDTFGRYIQSAFDAMAMGNYPFKTYFFGGTPEFPAPAYPMRVACEAMRRLPNAPDADASLEQLRAAIAVMYNTTKQVPCFDILGINPTVTSPIWDYMVCTERMINEMPEFAASGWPNDMFWKQPVYDKAKLDKHCMDTYGVKPRYGILNLGLGARNVPASSNIVFANGDMDPWHTGGILTSPNPTILTPQTGGAHHLDLFFPTANDSTKIIGVRELQLEEIKKWIKEAQNKTK